MRRKIVLTVLLCLATALAIGAAPALAASGCTCHTDEPPTATAAHEPFVASVTDCTTCHKAMSPHPDPTSLARASLNLGFAAVSHKLSGTFMLRGVTVYLQQRLWGANDFTDIAQVTTASGLWSGGKYSYTVPSPTPWVAYRAVAEGGRFMTPRTYIPALAVWLPTPTLSLRLSGLTRGAVRRGHAVIVAGKVTPTDMAGQKVRLTLQKRNAHFRWSSRWSGKYHPAVMRTISATGAYSWKYTPKLLGQYRVKAKIPNTSAYNSVVTDWRRFRVK